MNGTLGDAAIDEAVRIWWPQLEAGIESISIPAKLPEIQDAAEPPRPKTSVEELLEEILRRIRSLEAHQRHAYRTPSASAPTRVPHPLFQGVLELANASGLSVSHGNIRDESVLIEVDNLPCPVPGYGEFGEFAKHHGVELVLQGPDRKVTYDRLGIADEAPF